MCMNSVFMCVFVDYGCMYVFVYMLLSLGVWFFYVCVFCYVFLCVDVCVYMYIYACVCVHVFCM